MFSQEKIDTRNPIMKKTNHMKIAALTLMGVSAFAFNGLAGDYAVTQPAPQVDYGQSSDFGFYLSGFGGVNLIDDFTVPSSGLSADLDTGYAVGGAVGTDLGLFRLEVEGTWRDNGIDSVTFGGTEFDSDGDLTSWSAMGNLLFDIPVTNQLTAYLGGGLGAAGVGADFGYGRTSIDDDDVVFAWQGIAGVSYAFTPSTEAYVEYRYFTAEDPELGSGSNAIEFDSYESHSILAGVRIHF